MESTEDLPWSFLDEGFGDCFSDFSSTKTQSTAETVAIEASSTGPTYPESNLGGSDEDDFDLALAVRSSFETVFCFCLQEGKMNKLCKQTFVVCI